MFQQCEYCGLSNQASIYMYMYRIISSLLIVSIQKRYGCSAET